MEPLQASAEPSHFPEPRARPRPTGKTKSAAEVHKRSPAKALVVPQQGERKGDGLLGLVPKTSSAAAGNVTYIEVTNQAMLERTTIGGGTTRLPAREQPPKSTPSSPPPVPALAPKSTPSSLPPGTVVVPCKLHTCPAGRSQLDDLREAYAMSSSSSEQSPKSTGPAVASALEAQTGAEAAADPSPVNPISVDPSYVETPNVGPTSMDTPGADPSSADPQRADPQSADPKSVDPPDTDPSVVGRTHVDLTTSDPTGAISISSGVEPSSADPTSADPDPNSADSVIIDPASADTNDIAFTNVDITKATPTGTVPMRVDRTNVDPTGVDPSRDDPTTAGPTSVDPSSVDLPGVDPTRADPTGAAPSSTKGKDTATLLEATQHVATAVAVSALEDAPQVRHHVLTDSRLANSLLAQLLVQSSAASGPVGMSTGENELLHDAGPRCNNVSNAPMSDDITAAGTFHMLYLQCLYMLLVDHICQPCTARPMCTCEPSPLLASLL